VAQNPPIFNGVLDIRSHLDWLNADLKLESVEGRRQLLEEKLGTNRVLMEKFSEKVKILRDNNNDGIADFSRTFAEGFTNIADGIGAGLLAVGPEVYYTCIPNLWILSDTNQDAVADVKNSVQDGFGVHISFLGHDLHGLQLGPDGRIYFSIGDRGLNLTNREGTHLYFPHEGTVLRCEPDGSKLEIFARGLRNPQELAFDDFGNLFTGDNNSDGGDKARWLHVVEGADFGWRIGYQHLHAAPRRGPWNSERMWEPQNPDQPAYILPPIANIGYGPSGIAYYPGIGLSTKYRGHFFLCDFRGAASSGIHTFGLKARGASFEIVEYEQFVWDCLPTDVDFGPGGGVYFTDWVQGWNKTGKGRIFHVFDPQTVNSSEVLETKKVLNAGFAGISLQQLSSLLENLDLRLRRGAQFELVNRFKLRSKPNPGDTAPARQKTDDPLEIFFAALKNGKSIPARLHALWGIDQIIRLSGPAANERLISFLDDSDPEIRAQTARVLGDQKEEKAFSKIVGLMNDSNARVRFYATLACSKFGKIQALSIKSAPEKEVVKMLEVNNDNDANLRFAGIQALRSWSNKIDFTRFTNHASPAVRLTIAAALRDHTGKKAALALYLSDPEPRVAAEAARGIYDEPSKSDDLILNLAETLGKSNLPPAVLNRALNAHFYLGENNNARAIAAFAMNKNGTVDFRAAAFQMLAHWPENEGRDLVHGNWIKRKARTVESGRRAISEIITRLEDENDNQVLLAAIPAIQTLKPVEGISFLTRSVNQSTNTEVRTLALRALADFAPADFKTVLRKLQRDGDETVKSEANRLLAMSDPAEVLEMLSQSIESSNLRTKQSSFQTLGSLQGSKIDEILVKQLRRLVKGDLERELQLDLLEAVAKRPNPEILSLLVAYESSKPKIQMTGYLESLAGGDPAKGRQIFFERAELSCLRCHKINGEGGDVGPELAGLGKKYSREYLLESVLWPNNQIAPGYENVTVTLQNGSVLGGPVKSETPTELVIQAGEDGLVTIQKADIKTREKGLSAMPEEFRQIMTKQDVRNLVEFLSTL